MGSKAHQGAWDSGGRDLVKDPSATSSAPRPRSSRILSSYLVSLAVVSTVSCRIPKHFLWWGLLSAHANSGYSLLYNLYRSDHRSEMESLRDVVASIGDSGAFDERNT